ncbi:hypothetical protein ATEIFO6365_0016013300 [Aspergillus terreus]|uniref:Uncharacterized protein n=1 Tax=Aspergillus terreus TaxID=33178 RepID=A0A5M3ZE63_ASPTE|nr:hypothetical protein ATETN484_0017013800 [Aspergillus terreus]GFF21809.1 hypothetical protein ATEIFO6365_0016013300 [Aspergillus terreus]
MTYTIELVNNSGSPGKYYNIFSAKAGVEGGGNTPDTVKSVVWFRSTKLGPGQRDYFSFSGNFYGFFGAKRGGTNIHTRDTMKVVVGSPRDNGTILLLDRSYTFSSIDPDDDLALPDNQEFKIATNAALVSNNNVIGVAREKETPEGAIAVAPTNIVDLKGNVTYTFTVNKAVYIKATDAAEGTIQTCPDDNDKRAVKVEFSGRMKKAVVFEDSRGHFTVTYSPGDD